MPPHSSLSVVPDILAIQTNVSHRNSRMYGLSKVRALHHKPYKPYHLLTIKFICNINYIIIKLF